MKVQLIASEKESEKATFRAQSVVLVLEKGEGVLDVNGTLIDFCSS